MSSDSEFSKSKPNVVITGFGLFGCYSSNPSWEAVKLLESSKVNLIKKQVDVIYETVDKVVPDLWNEKKPSLIIHVGVSCMAKGLVLESCAHSSGYHKPDATECYAECQVSKLAAGCVECLTTELDVQSLCNHLNQLYESGELKLNATVSKDAGRYLCEYIYYSSLKFNQKRTLFVHVPEINDKLDFTIENIRSGLKAILDYLIDQI